VIVVDASAIVAMVKVEPGWDFIRDTLDTTERALIAAPTMVELGLVLGGMRPDREDLARTTVLDADLEVVPFDQLMAERAITAWHRFGKGRHPARLNLGDCFTYALAWHTSYPILCVGDDFAQTDLPTLRPPA